MSEGALHDLKVLEYGEFVSGPYCTKLLADLGAEVTKIEKPVIGDMARRRGPFLGDIPHPEHSGLFLYLNTNKLGITLNPSTTTGKKIFKELIEKTDILVEANQPKMMEDSGLSYEKLKEINPKLIMTSITPFGQTGPYKDYKAYNLNVFLSGGLGCIFSKHPPTKTGGFVGDYAGGLNAALGTLGAVSARDKNGSGQHVDVSKQETMIGLQRVTAVTYPNEGQSKNLMTLLGGSMGGLMKCEDGHAIATTAEAHQWKNFTKLIEKPEFGDDKRYVNMFSRAVHYKKIEPHVTEWMMSHTKEEIYHKGQALSCPIVPVRSSDEIVNCKQMEARDFFLEIDHPEAGRLKYPQAAYRFSKTPWKVYRRAPLLGEHNEEIYCNRLGYTKKDLVMMAEGGII